MGGGTRKNSPDIRSKARKNITYPLFPNYENNGYAYPAMSQSIMSQQVGYTSEKKPDDYLGKKEHDEMTINIITLFISMCYILKEKYKAIKNKKLQDFINKFEEVITLGKYSSEFKNFQKYCSNKSIQQYHGYEVVRRFMTKYFSDTSGVFMKMKRDEWVQYVNRFLKK